MMRIFNENEDYVIKKEFQSELNNEVYKPENYFINKAVSNKLFAIPFTLELYLVGQFLIIMPPF
jgi:hypothetical protein